MTVPMTKPMQFKHAACSYDVVCDVLRCICLDSNAPHANNGGGNVDRIEVTIAPPYQYDTFLAEVVRRVEAEPNATGLHVVVKDPGINAYYECASVLLILRLSLGRMLSCTVDQFVQKLPEPWSKGFCWRATFKDLPISNPDGDGVSPASLDAFMQYIGHVAKSCNNYPSP